MTEDRPKDIYREEDSTRGESVPSNNTTDSTETGQPWTTPKTSKPADASEKTVKDNFKPFYKKEAKLGSLYKGVLFVLLVLLGLDLVSLAAEAFMEHAPYRIENTALVVIILAVIGLLWKTVSLEAKVGIAVLGVALSHGIAHTLYAGADAGIFGLPGGLLFSFFLILLAVSIILTIWRVWPKRHWLPIVLTVIVFFASLSPVLAVVLGQTSLGALITGPDIFHVLPIYLRPGWLLFQLILPLGALLLLYRQFGVRMKPQYESHWGYVLWALAVLVAATVGLTALERAGHPSFPAMTAQIARVFPQAADSTVVTSQAEPEPVAPGTTEVPQLEAPPEPVAPEKPMEQPTPPEPGASPGEAGPAEGQTPAITGQPTQPGETESGQKPETGGEAQPSGPAEAPEAAMPESGTPEQTPGQTAQPEMQAPPAPAPPEAPAAEQKAPPSPLAEKDREEFVRLQDRVTELEKEVNSLKGRLDAHDQLIRALFEYFRVEMDNRKAQPKQPEPEPAPEAKPSEPEKAPEAAPAPSAPPALPLPPVSPAPALPPHGDYT